MRQKWSKKRWEPKPAIEMFTIMLENSFALQIRRSKKGDVFELMQAVT